MADDLLIKRQQSDAYQYSSEYVREPVDARNQSADDRHADDDEAERPKNPAQRFVSYIPVNQHGGASHYHADEHGMRRRERSLRARIVGHNNRPIVDDYVFKEKIEPNHDDVKTD